jgi:hypothetical protein
MNTALQHLLELQQDIAARNEPEWDDDVCEKLLLSPIDGLVHVEFYGSPFDESFDEFTRVLGSPDVARHVRSLVFRGPDEGANGTRKWDFSSLIQSETLFPNLRSFVVEPTLPEHHNHTIIAREYEEEGQIARLVAKMPLLTSLTVPSAPGGTFFDIALPSLHTLRVEAGYDTQNFILNFSQASGFKHLRHLDFGDYNQRYMDDYPAGYTPFEHFEALFRSSTFSGPGSFLGAFTLRNSILTPEQLSTLHHLRKDCQFRVIQAPSGDFVR